MSRQQGSAGYADIMNAPSGTGFGNKPRITGDTEMVSRLTTPPPKPPSHTLEVLKSGTAQDSRPLGDGGNANSSVIVTLEDGTEAVYKPERGENWTASFANSDINQYLKNRQFSLAEREAFAFEVDSALGLGIVPETVLREEVDETHIDVDTSGGAYHAGGGGGYDSYEARQQYKSYQEKAQENAMDDVGQEMYQLFNEAKDEHAADIGRRADEMADIWNELVDEYPNLEAEREAALGVKEHPVLPMGSKPPFERRSLDTTPIDPLEILDEAEVDVSAKMSVRERDKVKEILRKRMVEDGADQLGDVDEDAAKEHLDYDSWLEDHSDTEARLYESKIQTFTEWRKDNGYNSSYSGSGSGSGGGFNRNDQAPHPKGGSFQHFMSDADSYGDITQEGGAKLAVLDYVIGSMDRHPSNLMFDGDNPVAIDNGYSMPASNNPDDFSFRSHGVRDWISNHGTVPEGLRSTLHDLATKTDWEALADRHPNMNAKERAAFLGRAEKIKTALETPDGLRQLWKRLDNTY
jgi:hypothetical protein